MIGCVIHYIGPTPDVIKREWNRLKKEAYQHIGEYWHARFMPKHFTHRGAREYRYQPRQGESGNASDKGFRRSYTGQKLRKYKHTLPLVFTGETKVLAAQRDVRSTSKGCRVVIRANRLNLINRRAAKPINMREEMTTVSPAEQAELARQFNIMLDRRLRAIHSRRSVKVG